MISLRQTLALSISSLAAAQWLDDKLLGSCADVECPQADNVTISVECQIGNQTYGGVGVDTFPFNSSDPDSDNITWTIAYHDYTNYDPDRKLERTLEKALFLGTPEDLNLTTAAGWGGCAVILEAYDKVVDTNSGLDKCEDVIGSECHEELRDDTQRFAREQGNRVNSSSDACDRLEEYLKSVSREDSKCRMDWTQVHYIRKFSHPRDK
jgi:hypothetical protein